MKTSNIFLGVMVVWVGYELYKNHTAKATWNAMKADINKLKNKVMSHTSDGHGDDVAASDKKSTDAATSPIVNSDVHAANTVTGGNNSAWSQYVGQPIYNEVVTPNYGPALRDYSGYCYNSQFRKKPTAFSGFNGWKY